MADGMKKCDGSFNARKKIEDASKGIKCFYVQGTTCS